MGTKRPLDSGRKSVTGATIRVSDQARASAADAPPPSTRELPRHLVDLAPPETFGRINTSTDLTETELANLEPGDVVRDSLANRYIIASVSDSEVTRYDLDYNAETEQWELTDRSSVLDIRENGPIDRVTPASNPYAGDRCYLRINPDVSRRLSDYAVDGYVSESIEPDCGQFGDVETLHTYSFRTAVRHADDTWTVTDDVYGLVVTDDYANSPDPDTPIEDRYTTASVSRIIRCTDPTDPDSTQIDTDSIYNEDRLAVLPPAGDDDEADWVMAAGRAVRRHARSRHTLFATR